LSDEERTVLWVAVMLLPLLSALLALMDRVEDHLSAPVPARRRHAARRRHLRLVRDTAEDKAADEEEDEPGQERAA
jgi:hypothetical protein